MANYVEDFNNDGNITSTWWPAGSRVKLVHVNWDPSYRDVVIFDDAAARAAYFDALGDYYSYTIENMSYLKPSQAIKVPLPYSTAYRYNYIEVINPKSPKYDETRLYYFITRADYVAPSTTLLTIQLDVMMSYQDKIQIGSCFLNRGHVALANTGYRDALANDRQRLMTRYLDVPEGLDVGSDYVTVGTECVSLSDDGYYVMMLSTADLTAPAGGINSPNLQTAQGMQVDRLISGCDLWAMEVDSWRAWMYKMRDKPWVTQCLVAIYTFPKRFVTHTTAYTLEGETAYLVVGSTSQTVTPTDPATSVATIPNVFERFKAALPWWVRQHDKLSIFPYSFIEVTANTGTSVLLKPQYLHDNEVALKAICCAVYPFTRIGIIPWRYGAGPRAGLYSVAWEDPTGTPHTSTLFEDSALSNALYLSDFPMFSIVNNSYITYMASTAHSRAYSYEAAGWQLARTSMANELVYQQQQQGLDVAARNQQLSQQLGYGQMALNAGVGAIGVIGQAATGNIGGAIGGAAGIAAGAASSAMSLGTQQAQFQNTQNLQGYIAGSNYDLANRAATGDYAMAIQAIDSKVQDAALLPPSQAGQAGGDAFSAANGLWNITINFKMAAPAALSRISDYFSRYGYAINEWVSGQFRPMRSLKVMDRFSYWKMTEAYLVNAQATTEELMTVKGILERGVTVWDDPALIGSPSLDYNNISENRDWSY